MHDKSIPLPDVWRTCNKIRAAVFRSGLDLWEWFLPLDPNRDTLIPECKFVGVLAGPGLRSMLALSAQEVAQLADYFRAQDGRVLYAQLCRLVHGEESSRSEKPLPDKASPSPSEHVGARAAAADEARTAAALAALDSQQARRMRTLMSALAARQIPLQPYFQDYELVAQNDGGVTFPHFGRAISSTGVPLAPDDLALLVRCFIRDAYTVDYVRFLRALEAQRNGVDLVGAAITIWAQAAASAVSKASAAMGPGAVAVKAASSSAAAAAAAGAGRRGGGGGGGCAITVPDLMHRIQKRVYQRRIRVSEWFRDSDPLNGGRVTRAQFARGLDAVAGGELTQAEVCCLAAHYTDPNDADRVCWRTFEDDCERVFTTKELEKHPELDAVKTAANARASDADVEIQAQDACARALSIGAGHALARRRRRPPPRDPAETDILLILAKIKEKMVREGVRPLQFLQQYDLHNELVIPRADFYRGLASSGVALTPLEMDTLMEVFAAPGRRRLVEYFRFCETVSEALVQGGLERAPLLQPVSHAPPGPVPHLSLEERQAVSRALTQLASRRERAALLRDIFNEMDRNGSGRVSRGQAERALSSSGALHAVSTREREALYKCFSGGSPDQVAYRALCRSLDVLLAARGR